MIDFQLKRLGGCKPLPPVDRFYSSYTPDPNSGCWLWLGRPRGSLPYGSITVNGRLEMAHRFSWELKNGPVPEGMQVCHLCDVPCCVNPDHLFIGTIQDNSDDKVRKGRQAKGSRLAAAQSRNKPIGERSGTSKLTAKQVDEIRLSNAGSRAIAPMYGVSSTTINHIRSGKTWRHIL